MIASGAEKGSRNISNKQKREETPPKATHRKAESSQPNQNSSPSKLPYCEESFQQFYFTKPRSRKSRVLRALHLLPKSDRVKTCAEVAVQVGAPAGGWNTDHGGPLTFRLSQYEKVNKELNDLLCQKDRQLEELQRTLMELKFEKERTEEARKSKEAEAERLLEERLQLQQQLERIEETMETTQLENEFLTEDKEQTQEALDKSSHRIGQLHREIRAIQEERDSLAQLFIDTKVSCSELLGGYLEGLNNALEERREWLQTTKKGASEKIKKLISTAEQQLRLQAERNHLVEQVEYLSAKNVAQDFHIDQMQQHMSELAKALYAYEEVTGLQPEVVAEQHVSFCGLERLKTSFRRNDSKGESSFMKNISLDENPVKTSTPIKHRPNGNSHGDVDRRTLGSQFSTQRNVEQTMSAPAASASSGSPPSPDVKRSESTPPSQDMQRVTAKPPSPGKRSLKLIKKGGRVKKQSPSKDSAGSPGRDKVNLPGHG